MIRGLVTSYSGEFGEILFKHRQVRCKKKHILPPQAATSPVFALLRRGKEENLWF